MEGYISKNMFRRKIELKCDSGNGIYIGVVEQVIDKVLVLSDDKDQNVYINIDKIESFKALD